MDERRSSDALLRNLQEQFNTHVEQQRDDNKSAIERFERLFDKIGEAVNVSVRNGDVLQDLARDAREEKKERVKLADRVAELERARQSDRVSRKLIFALITGAWGALATIGALVIAAADTVYRLVKGK